MDVIHDIISIFMFRVRLGLGLCLVAALHISIHSRATENMEQIKWPKYSKDAPTHQSDY